MPLGFFTQSACVLLERPVTLDELEPVLAKLPAVRERLADDVPRPGYAQALANSPPSNEDPATSAAYYCGPAIVLPFRAEANGKVLIDIVSHPWPDSMGDPQTEPQLFGAWATGQFGPLTFPGGLRRASAQSWSWEPGRSIVDKHTAFARIRTSYVLGSGPDAPLAPDDYQPLPELIVASEIALAVLNLPGALCYYNPNGEILRDRQGLQDSLAFAQQNKLLPFDVWSNIRLFPIDPAWALMDTVGCAQWDLPDQEALFSRQYDFGEVDRFLQNVRWHLLQQSEPMKDGTVLEGPGKIGWRLQHHKHGLTEPPRRVLTWTPEDGTDVPEDITSQRVIDPV